MEFYLNFFRKEGMRLKNILNLRVALLKYD